MNPISTGLNLDWFNSSLVQIFTGSNFHWFKFSLVQFLTGSNIDWFKFFCFKSCLVQILTGLNLDWFKCSFAKRFQKKLKSPIQNDENFLFHFHSSSTRASVQLKKLFLCIFHRTEHFAKLSNLKLLLNSYN